MKKAQSYTYCKVNLEFSPIKSIKKEILGEASKYVVNGGGGMGGSRREIHGTERGKDSNGFLLIESLFDGQIVKVNPAWISTIDAPKKFVKITVEHENHNFKKKSFYRIYSYNVKFDLDFSGYCGASLNDAKDEFGLSLHETDLMNCKN